MAALGILIVVGAPVLSVLAGFALTRRTGVGANELFRRGLYFPRYVMAPPPVVATVEWMSFHDAAEFLGLSVRRVRTTANVRAIVRASNALGEIGVTRSSVEHELEWRRTATKRERLRRLLAILF
jgi:hypothetical protein